MTVHGALRYAARGWRVFPCHWAGDRRKQPLTAHGCRDATDDHDQIYAWWRRWPEALIGFATGVSHHLVVLDTDMKNPAANGLDTLAGLGFGVLPTTPLVHTPSGGLHLYFREPEGIEIRNTAGVVGRGIGPGLDWRGAGGYVILPSPGSGYRWDPDCNFRTCAPIVVPAGLLPREPVRLLPAKPVRPCNGLSPYADAALDSATKKILGAPDSKQEKTLNAECFSIGTLAGAGAVPSDFARRALKWAAGGMVSYDPKRPWRAKEVAKKVDAAFDAGMRHPRRAAR